MRDPNNAEVFNEASLPPEYLADDLAIALYKLRLKALDADVSIQFDSRNIGGMEQFFTTLDGEELIVNLSDGNIVVQDHGDTWIDFADIGENYNAEQMVLDLIRDFIPHGYEVSFRGQEVAYKIFNHAPEMAA